MIKTIIIFGREARRAMKKKNGEGGNDSDEDNRHMGCGTDDLMG